MDTDTMILRFRDLVTSENGTIERHKAIIAEHGYVWWGWWNKGSEEVPDDFSLLSTQAKESPISIFLVDSGQNLLYRAACSDIEVHKKTKSSSPNKDKTPEYYRDQDYYAWFRFTSIEHCEEDELKQYSYIHCNNLFKDLNTDFSRFENKRVYSIAELVQQNRTVWFVRRAKETDLANEIILLDAEYVQPSHFSKKYYQAAGDTLLWLSDLHLSDNVFEHIAGKPQPTLAQHICGCVRTHEIKAAGLLISGDITSCAKSDGFQIAKDMLRDINTEVLDPLKPENILICPGNHDFKRAHEDLGKDAQPALISEMPDGADTTKDFADFYCSLYKIKPNKYFASGKKILLSSGYILEFAALNSVMLQQYPNFEGHGFLSQEQLDFVADQMGWNNNSNQNAIRIVMMHHHYLPTCYVEVADANKASSVVYDADRLMNWLTRCNVKLLLHGHKHKSFVVQVAYPKKPTEDITSSDALHKLTIVGMGGTGAKNADNKLATIAFEGSEVTIQFYRLHSDQISEDAVGQEVKIQL